MSEQPVMRKQTPRWQDVRAKAIDSTFDADRRRAGERVALVFRSLFLIVIGALNNLNPSSTPEEKVVIAAQGCPTQAISVWRDGAQLA